MNLFNQTIRHENTGRPAVWFMRQAGRYHSHYQALRSKYDFITLCKDPEIACEVTMGPIRDFDFDAAILFSDLLFPLEAMGMGLTYEPGPKLSFHVKTMADISRLRGGEELAKHMQFQADAMKLIRKSLPESKGLLGFVGGPLTLFCYAVDGSHQGGLHDSKIAVNNGMFEAFCELLIPMLAANMELQAKAGADTIAVMDTCAGEFPVEVYRQKVVPQLKRLFSEFKKRCPSTPITYYTKGTTEKHWDELEGLPIACLGIDWRHDIGDVLKKYGSKYAIQGNFDPHLMLELSARELEPKLRAFFESAKQVPKTLRQGWVCGLGHGVLPKTPEENVKLFMRLQREVFGS